MALKQKCRDVQSVRPRSPGERCRSVLLVARRDIGSGIEQDRRAFDRAGAADGVALTSSYEVQQRLMLPVHQVRTHAVSQERAQHVGVPQKIALATREDRWHTQP